MIRYVVIAAIFLSMLFALHLQLAQNSGPSAQGSIKGEESIPASRRADLKLKLSQLIELYRKSDWSAVYAQLAHFPPVEESSRQFAERMASAYPRSVGKALIAFQPESIIEQPTSQWAVWGCATLRGQDGRASNEIWLVTASWERSAWYFSELLPASLIDAKKPTPCTV